MNPGYFKSIKEAVGLLQRLKNNTGAKTSLGAVGAGIATVAASAVGGAIAGGAGFAAPGAAIGGLYAAYKVTQKNSDYKNTSNLGKGAKKVAPILDALKKKKIAEEKLDEKRTPKKLGKVLINNLLKKASAKKNAHPKGQKTAEKIKKPKIKEDIEVFEDWKDHQKSHKDKAKEYAGKIKSLLDDYASNSSEYDTWDIKDVSRRLEDMYESLDNTVDRKKRWKAQAAQAAKVSEDVEQIDELSKPTLKSYVKKAGENVTATTKKVLANKDTSIKSLVSDSKSLVKGSNRLDFISKARDKIRNEEVTTPDRKAIFEKFKDTFKKKDDKSDKKSDKKDDKKSDKKDGKKPFKKFKDFMKDKKGC